MGGPETSPPQNRYIRCVPQECRNRNSRHIQRTTGPPCPGSDSSAAHDRNDYGRQTGGHGFHAGRAPRRSKKLAFGNL